MLAISCKSSQISVAPTDILLDYFPPSPIDKDGKNNVEFFDVVTINGIEKRDCVLIPLWYFTEWTVYTLNMQTKQDFINAYFESVNQK